MSDSKKILIIAGEASGDMHGAKLVKELKLKDSSLSFFGMAGPAMRDEGVESVVDVETMSIMGFVEVLTNIVTIWKAYRAIKKAMLAEKPDLVVLIDYPGFNLRIAKLAKKLGIKTLYYISPKVWAWKKGRVKTIKKNVDQMAVIFPFEVKLYEDAGVPVRFVGLPLLDELPLSLTKSDARAQLKLDENKTTIVLLPGSRKSEMKYIFPVILEAAKKLQTEKDNLQFILPVASTLDKAKIENTIKPFALDVKVIEGKAHQAMKAADVAICTSGTATLETALMETPMVVLYRGNALSAQIAKLVIKIDYFSLCNIVAQKEVVKEFFQEMANSEAISAEVSALLDDSAYYQQQKNELIAIKQGLSQDKIESYLSDLVLQSLRQ